MYPFTIDIIDPNKANDAGDQVEIGHFFAFLKNGWFLNYGARKGRLLGHQTKDRRVTVALCDEPVELGGVRIHPGHRAPGPLGAIVTDRDLYRAEQDSVHLFIAAPSAPKDLALKVLQNGVELTHRAVELEPGGVTIDTLSMLLPGNYEAQLHGPTGMIGNPARFTVAEYTLAPLSARLVRHTLDRSNNELSFELGVESYQVAFDRRLAVELIDGSSAVARAELDADEAGVYRGELPLSGEGPFRLRLSAVGDASRVAEVAIPGTRAHERSLTLISELGTERHFSMLPEPGALPVRGGFLTEGDHIATPITVESIITRRGRLQVHTDVEALTLVIADLVDGSFRTIEVGDRKAGEHVEVPLESSMSTVFTGCFVDGSPFEGYASFFREQTLGIDLGVPERAQPGEDIEVRISVDGTAEEVPVLLAIRDERLTARDTPAVALGSTAKQNIAELTKALQDEFDFARLSDVIAAQTPQFAPMMPMMSGAGGARQVAMAPRMRRGGGALGMIANAVDAIRSESIQTLGVPGEMELDASLEGAELDDIYDGPAFEEASIVKKAKRGHASSKSADKGGAHTDSAPEARAAFPEVLFYGIVRARGETFVNIPLSDSLTTFTVEAFALSDGDWCHGSTTLTVDQPVRVDMELPPAVHPEDVVFGTLRAAVESGRAKVTLSCDGKATAIGEHPVGPIEVDTPAELRFHAGPGTYRVEVEDLETGERDAVEKIVGEPGRFKSYVRELALLEPGRALTLDSEDAVALRVLPSLDEPFQMLTEATAGYAHLCCEQTAAKILSAVTMYLSADGPAAQKKAEEIIIAGIAREKRMIQPGKGFAAYPESKDVYEPYSRLATRRLWSLHQLDAADDVSPALKKAIQEGVEMADVAGRAHNMDRVPKRIGSIEDAYALASLGDEKGRRRARAFVDEVIDWSDHSVRSVAGESVADMAKAFVGRVIGVDSARRLDPVSERMHLAYAAAILLSLGELAKALRLANRVTRQFNENGRLYSTVDSVAAIALMIQLRVSGVGSGAGKVSVNGRTMTSREAVELSDAIESIEVLEGVSPVEITRIKVEDWTAFTATMPITVGFRDEDDQKARAFRAGDKTDLVVKLPKGYKFGDLLHVALPASMSWISGGGKVKKFTLDFEGETELRVPLVVTEALEGQQRFCVCVRNMFEEERVTNPGLLTVRAA